MHALIRSRGYERPAYVSEDSFAWSCTRFLASTTLLFSFSLFLWKLYLDHRSSVVMSNQSDVSSDGNCCSDWFGMFYVVDHGPRFGVGGGGWRQLVVASRHDRSRLSSWASIETQRTLPNISTRVLPAGCCIIDRERSLKRRREEWAYFASFP